MKNLKKFEGKAVKNAVAVKGGNFVHEYQQNEKAAGKNFVHEYQQNESATDKL